MTEREQNLLKTAARMHAQEVRRQYQREWRRKNPEKCKQYMQKYWEKKAREEILQDCGAV